MVQGERWALVPQSCVHGSSMCFRSVYACAKCTSDLFDIAVMPRSCFSAHESVCSVCDGLLRGKGVTEKGSIPEGARKGARSILSPLPCNVSDMDEENRLKQRMNRLDPSIEK